MPEPEPEPEPETPDGYSRITRTTRAVLARDWTAVAVELVLVVAGILIAIEVDRWNALRVAERKETYYVDWLLESLDESIELTDLAIRDLGSRSRDAFWVADRLREEVLDAEDEPRFERAFLGLGRWTHGRLIDAPFRELRALGTGAGLTDRDLRRAVALFETRWADRSDSVEHVKLLMIRLVTPLLLLRDEQLDGSERRLVTPFSELCATDSSRIVTQLAMLYAALGDYSGAMKRDMLELKGALREAAASTADRAAGPRRPRE